MLTLRSGLHPSFFALAAGVALSLATVAPAVSTTLAQSTFGAGAEGWTNVMLPYPSAVPATVLNTFTPQWSASSGGYIWMTDPDGSGSSGDAEYWGAPAAYLGAKSAAYGGELSFRLANVGSGFGPFTQEDVLLIGGGLTLVRSLPLAPGSSFSAYVVPMTEPGWKVGGLLGPDATESQFRAVLAGVDHLYVRAEFQLGPDTQYLDDVLLTSGTLEVPRQTESGFALTAPTPNPAAAAARLQLSLPREATGQVSVHDASGRLVAILGAGSWPAGVHSLEWNGLARDGGSAGAGLYWIHADFGELRISRRLVRIR